MPMELIKKIRDELSELNYAGRWHPFMYNEPLRDDRLLKIIRMFRKAVPRIVINISTNCDYLTPELLDELVDAGVNQFILNIYSARDGSDNEAKVEKGIEIAKKRAALVQSWLDARPHILQTGSMYNGFTAKKVAGKVMHKYGVQQDGTNFGSGTFKLSNRSQNVEWLKDEEKVRYSGTCTSPFRVMEMRYTGDVVLCCNDYHGVTSMGNIKDHTLVELWNSMKMHKKRYELQSGIRKGFCAGCNSNGGTRKHMIHPVQLERGQSLIMKK